MISGAVSSGMYGSADAGPAARVVCRSAREALSLLVNPQRLVATLRS